MKVTVAHRSNPQQKDELIELSCRTHLSKISNNIHDVKYLVTQICKRNYLAFSIPLGSVCAHVAKHYSPDIMMKGYADVYICDKLVSKFRTVFMQEIEGESKIGLHQSERGVERLDKLARYGRICLVFTMKSQFKQSITNLKQFDETLTSIIKKLLSSLLLEYVPSQHSRLMLKLYLQDCQTEQERVWMQDNRRKHEDIYPYHDFFQVLCSLSYHILNTRKALNWKHYLEILANPCEGSVEWPMVLGVRNLHKLPYPI